ncbi:MAG: hypothetical protein FWD02_03830 [Bacteroidales bacterium]|nr:hypothetical protein [Bacteroidales bacterium]
MQVYHGSYIKIDEVDFLQELTYHEETHQVCFCTLKSLLTLKSIDKSQVSKFGRIGEAILEKLMIDLNIDENQATDIFYSSKIFANISENPADFHEKSWQEIYEMLKVNH